MKKLFINLLLLAFGLFVSLIMGEFLARGYLRYQDSMIQAKNRDNILTQVPKKELYTPMNPGNFTNRANATVHWWGHRIRTDSLGCRTGIAAPDSAKTILFIGDSMIFGLGLPDSSTIPSLLQEELNHSIPQSPVHVINAGVIGYDLQRYHYQLQRLIPVIKPDLILVGLCYNDLLPNEDPYGDVAGTLIPLGDDSTGGKIFIPRKLPRPSELSIIRGALRSSALYTLWSQAGLGSQKSKVAGANVDPLKKAGLERAPQLIDEFLRAAEEMKVPTAFVYFPIYQSLGQDSDLIYLGLLRERGCAVLDLSHSTALNRESYFYRENRGHLLPDIHFNLTGSRAVAEEIAQWLIQHSLRGKP